MFSMSFDFKENFSIELYSPEKRVNIFHINWYFFSENVIFFSLSKYFQLLFIELDWSLKSNTNYYEISKQTFIRLFKFDLETIKLLDHTNQCIRPSFPVLLRKPRFLIRKNSWYKSIINNKLETIYFSYELLNFSLSINCEVI